MNAADKFETAGKVAGGVLGVWGILKLAFGIHKRIAAGVAKDVEERLGTKLDEKLAPVLKELRPNGGSSLADQVQVVITKLEHHSGRVRAFNRDAHEGMFESSPTGECVWVNRTYCRITERTESEVLGWGWLNTLHPEDEEAVREHWNDCVKEGRDYSRTQRFITPSGETILASVRAQPIRDSKGNLLGLMGFLRKVEDCNVDVEHCPLRRADEGGTHAH